MTTEATVRSPVNTPSESRRGRAPTPGYLDARIAEARIRYSARTRRINEILDLYFLRHEVPVPEEYKAWITARRIPTIRYVCDAVRDKLIEGRPTVSMTPADEGPTARALADKIESWDNAALKQLEQQAQREVYIHLTWWLAVTGWAYLYCEYTPQAWDEYHWAVALREEDESPTSRENRLENLKQRQPLPFFTTDLDPRSVYPFRDNQGIRECLIGLERSRMDVAQQYELGVGRDDQGRLRLRRTSLGEGTPYGEDPLSTGWGTVTFWTHITRARYGPTGVVQPGHVTYYADGEILKQWEHKYPFVPVFEMTGRATPLRHPEEASGSVAEPLLSLASAIDAQYTMLENWAYQSSFPQLVEETDVNAPEALDDGKPKPPLASRPGQATRLARGKHLNFLTPPPVGQTVMLTLESLQGQIERMSPLQPILLGDMRGIESGYMANQARREARTFRQPYLASLATGYERALEFLHWAIINLIHEPLTVLAVNPKDRRRKDRTLMAIGPDDLRRHYAVEVSITAEAPEHDIALMRSGIEAWKAGAITKEYMLEAFAKIPNASQMIDDRRLEDLFEDPIIKQWLVTELLRRRGLMDEVNQAAQQGQQNVLGPAGQPVNEPALPPGPNAGAAAGPGIGPAGPLEPIAAPAPPGSAEQPMAPMGGLPGVQIQPNTQALPGGSPV